MLESINACINPFSDKYFESAKQFAWLSTVQKIITFIASIAIFVVTLPLLGTGGYAVFNALVRLFTPRNRGEIPETDSVDNSASIVLNRKSDDAEVPTRIQSAQALRTNHNGGIPNIGNTCFMNSALQLILNTRLAEWIDREIAPPSWRQFSETPYSDGQLDAFIKTFKQNPELIADEELRKTLSRFLLELEFHWKKMIHQLAIRAFRDVYKGKRQDCSLQGAVRDLRSVFVDRDYQIVSLPRSYTQQDAAEFMSAALPSIGYGIKLRKSISSMDGVDQSQVDENCCYLSMPLPQEEGVRKSSLNDLIHCFQNEIVADQNCGWKIVDEQGVTIREHQMYRNTYSIVEEIPEVIVIQLKRFKKDQSGRTFSKDPMLIEIDEVVDLSSLIDPSLLNEGDSVKYRISGIINHSGGLTGGHYTATVNVGDRWERRSDAEVLERAGKALQSDRESGYMFVLERINSDF